MLLCINKQNRLAVKIILHIFTLQMIKRKILSFSYSFLFINNTCEMHFKNSELFQPEKSKCRYIWPNHELSVVQYDVLIIPLTK